MNTYYFLVTSCKFNVDNEHYLIRSYCQLLTHNIKICSQTPDLFKINIHVICRDMTGTYKL